MEQIKEGVFLMIDFPAIRENACDGALYITIPSYIGDLLDYSKGQSLHIYGVDIVAKYYGMYKVYTSGESSIRIRIPTELSQDFKLVTGQVIQVTFTESRLCISVIPEAGIRKSEFLTTTKRGADASLVFTIPKTHVRVHGGHPKRIQITLGNHDYSLKRYSFRPSIVFIRPHIVRTHGLDVNQSLHVVWEDDAMNIRLIT